MTGRNSPRGKRRDAAHPQCHSLSGEQTAKPFWPEKRHLTSLLQWTLFTHVHHANQTINSRGPASEGLWESGSVRRAGACGPADHRGNALSRAAMVPVTRGGGAGDTSHHQKPKVGSGIQKMSSICDFSHSLTKGQRCE